MTTSKKKELEKIVEKELKAYEKARFKFLKEFHLASIDNTHEIHKLKEEIGILHDQVAVLESELNNVGFNDEAKNQKYSK